MLCTVCTFLYGLSTRTAPHLNTMSRCLCNFNGAFYVPSEELNAVRTKMGLKIRHLQSLLQRKREEGQYVMNPWGGN